MPICAQPSGQINECEFMDQCEINVTSDYTIVNRFTFLHPKRWI